MEFMCFFSAEFHMKIKYKIAFLHTTISVSFDALHIYIWIKFWFETYCIFWTFANVNGYFLHIVLFCQEDLFQFCVGIHLNQNLESDLKTMHTWSYLFMQFGDFTVFCTDLHGCTFLSLCICINGSMFYAIW